MTAELAGQGVPVCVRNVWVWSQSQSVRWTFGVGRFCCSGVCSGVGSPGSMSPDFGQPLVNMFSTWERGRSPLIRVTLITEPLRPCPSMLCSFSLLRRFPKPAPPPLDRCRCLRLINQHTIRPDSAAPVENAETADTTRRFTDTKPSGSSMKLSCWGPNHTQKRKTVRTFITNKMRLPWGFFFTSLQKNLDQRRKISN